MHDAILMNDVKNLHHMAFNDKHKLQNQKGEESNDTLPEGASITFNRTAGLPKNEYSTILPNILQSISKILHLVNQGPFVHYR